MTLAMLHEMWRVADVRYAADVKVLHAPNERRAHLFGNEFWRRRLHPCRARRRRVGGARGAHRRRRRPCDHGGDITDEQRFAGSRTARSPARAATARSPSRAAGATRATGGCASCGSPSITSTWLRGGSMKRPSEIATTIVNGNFSEASRT